MQHDPVAVGGRLHGFKSTIPGSSAEEARLEL